MAWASIVRVLSYVSQKSLYGSRPNFMGSYLSAISPDSCFPKSVQFLRFLIFIYLFIYSFRSHWTPWEQKFQNTTPSFGPVSTKLYDKNILVVGEYKLLLFLSICQKDKQEVQGPWHSA